MTEVAIVCTPKNGGILCECTARGKGLDVQTLQQKPPLHAPSKWAFWDVIAAEWRLSTLKYWCKDLWNAPPASFWRWSRMRRDHQINVNAITFWALSRQRSPLGICTCPVFNPGKKKTHTGKHKQHCEQPFQFTNAWCVSGAVRGVCWNDTAEGRRGVNVMWWVRWDSNQVSVWRPGDA